MNAIRLLLALLCFVSVHACAPGIPAQPPAAPATEPSATALPPTRSEPAPTETPVVEALTPTSILEIAGIWDSRMLSERGYHEFKPDGTLILGYTIDQLRENPVFTEPVHYWFEGQVFHIEDACGHGTYRLTLYRENGENRKLTFEVIEDPCEQRIADWKVPMRWFEP